VTTCVYDWGEALPKKPIAGIASGFARAASGQAAADPANVMKSRRLTGSAPLGRIYWGQGGRSSYERMKNSEKGSGRIAPLAKLAG